MGDDRPKATAEDMERWLANDEKFCRQAPEGIRPAEWREHRRAWRLYTERELAAIRAVEADREESES